MKKLFAILAVAIFITGCDKPIEVAARDGLAVSSSLITKARDRWKDQCQVDPTEKPCVAINKAIDAQDVAINALEDFCNSSGFRDGTAPCQPNAALADKLQASLKDLQRNIKDVKELVQPIPEGKSPLTVN